MSGRRGRRPPGAPRGHHFLTGRAAGEIAAGLDIGPDDVVVELGAGHGRLTRPIARRARRVIAIELDRRLADRLAHAFGGNPGVTIVAADLLSAPLPRERFRVVANPPFHLTSQLLHRLLDDRDVRLQRADLVLGWGVALALTGVFGDGSRARAWAGRYEFLLIRRLPARVFEPEPPTDAAVVSIRPRRAV